MNKQQINRITFTVDGVIDEILRNPGISQIDLARMFGYSYTWVSVCVNSDAFKERLAERKAELTDPIIRASMQDRLDGIARTSMERIIKDLDNPASNIKHADLVAMAKLGVGDRNTRVAAPAVQQNLYVVNLPPPAVDAASWLPNTSRATPRPLPIAQEVTRG